MTPAPGLPLGIAGRTALVCGSSKGLGRACAEALAHAGVDVVLNGRSPGPLAQAAAELSEQCGRAVRSVAADVTGEEGRSRLFAECADPDILVTNCAGPPPGRFEDWGESEWHDALQKSMVTPIQLIRTAIGPMRARKWGRIINITSTSVKTPMPLLGLSNGARAGLTGFIAGLSREVAGDGVTINNLLPGLFATERLDAYVGALAKDRGLSPETMREQLASDNPTGRFGDPTEFGAACAFLASAQAGFITGQNWLLDGGAFRSVH